LTAGRIEKRFLGGDPDSERSADEEIAASCRGCPWILAAL
jgi:hypothetical protein